MNDVFQVSHDFILKGPEFSQNFILHINHVTFTKHNLAWFTARLFLVSVAFSDARH